MANHFSRSNFHMTRYVGLGICGNCKASIQYPPISSPKWMLQRGIINPILCDNCASLSCEKCTKSFIEHYDNSPYLLHCPNKKRERQAANNLEHISAARKRAQERDEIKKDLFGFVGKLTSSGFMGYLNALANFNTADILGLGGLYAATYKQAYNAITGKPVDIGEVERWIPKTAKEVPSFYKLGPLGEFLVSHAHKELGIAEARNISKNLLSSPQHPFWSAQETIRLNAPAITRQQFSNGLSWNGAWVPGVRNNKARGVTIKSRSNSGSFKKTGKLAELKLGQYKAFQFRAHPVGKGRYHAVGIFLAGGGWALEFPESGDKLVQVKMLAENKWYSPEKLENTRSDWNEVMLRYDHHGRAMVRINDQDIKGWITFNGSPVVLTGGVVGAKATFGRG